MRLWVSKSSEVPIRVQLEAQITLGILSNDLKPGERLPSTRELARRHNIHPNTVSAVFRQLAANGWVEAQRGSGVYVRKRESKGPVDGNLPLDRLISFFLAIGLDKGQSLSQIQAGLRRWLALPPPDHFLLIEPDPELRRIVSSEIEEATRARVVGVSPTEITKTILNSSAPVAMFRQAELIRPTLPRGTYLITLRSRSVVESLQDEKPPPVDALIAVVSCWSEFLRWSRLVLVAAGVDANALTFRDAREPGWEKGLRSATYVITDSLMARQIPAGCRPRVFHVVSDSAIAELQAFIKQFFK